jgi:UrcA family protein
MKNHKYFSVINAGRVSVSAAGGVSRRGDPGANSLKGIYPMMKSIVSAAAFALVAIPAAGAEPRVPVSLAFTYETGKVTTDEGVAELLGDLRREARLVCTQKQTRYGGPFIDTDCANDLVGQAVKGIYEAQSAAGVSVAPRLARLARVELARLD